MDLTSGRQLPHPIQELVLVADQNSTDQPANMNDAFMISPGLVYEDYFFYAGSFVGAFTSPREQRSVPCSGKNIWILDAEKLTLVTERPD